MSCLSAGLCLKAAFPSSQCGWASGPGHPLAHGFIAVKAVLGGTKRFSSLTPAPSRQLLPLDQIWSSAEGLGF